MAKDITDKRFPNNVTLRRVDEDTFELCYWGNPTGYTVSKGWWRRGGNGWTHSLTGSWRVADTRYEAVRRLWLEMARR